VFGGASLDRYAVPVFPILFAAIAAAGSAFPASWRWITRGAMTFALVMGFFWNPPYPFSFENNLAMTDFVDLQKDAASYLEAWAADKRVASAWPFTDALRRPEMGYVHRRMNVQQAGDLRLASLANLDRSKVDVLVVFCAIWMPEGGLMEYGWFREYLRRNWGYQAQATSEQIRNGLGFVPVMRITRHGQWIEIYVPER
jgi:hypothetical protein